MGFKLPTVAPIVALLIITLLVGASFYHYVEGMSWIDAFYFCIMTLTTVGGVGTLHPTTDLGKVFTMVYILFGVAIIASAANYLVHRALDMKMPKLTQKRHHKKAPPNKSTRTTAKPSGTENTGI